MIRQSSDDKINVTILLSAGTPIQSGVEIVVDYNRLNTLLLKIWYWGPPPAHSNFASGHIKKN